jgi:5-methylcytosine-specific restriction endonuclease McrA
VNAFRLLTGHARRTARCTCGAVELADAWVAAPTVNRYISALDLVDRGTAVDLRSAWLSLSPIRSRPEVNADALAAWQARQKRRTTLSPQVRAHILAAPACAYCASPATTIDHVVPTSRGGRHDRTNLVPACRRCNSAKGCRTPTQWLAALDGAA